MPVAELHSSASISRILSLRRAEKTSLRALLAQPKLFFAAEEDHAREAHSARCVALKF
jgi:hypothetical protein